jgi:predicted aldo/keto reductase-like oxidoreductase
MSARWACARNHENAPKRVATAARAYTSHMPHPLATSPFGRIGHQSTRVIFGAAAFSTVTQAEADATLDTLLEYGVNHIDTAASYGASEDRIGPWMQRGLRSRFFLATKTGERTYDKALAQIQTSLERMHVDSVDLIQLHCLIDDAEWDVAMGPGGALEACLEAQRQGLVKHIGVTGHELRVPTMHMRSVAKFDFDSVLLPWNFVLAQVPQYVADFDVLAADCRAHNRAIQTIKGITAAPWGAGERGDAPTWYRPLRDQADIDRAVAWVLGHTGIYLNTVGDIALLPKVLDAAARFSAGALAPPPQAEMHAMLGQRDMASLFV